ncbi:MAG: acyltransferase [Nevskia sp.]|jgi:peptidoglycan/LPS O-acetylase OafA/YrhL|nr:acyltransferase [Nevskia sp.]MCK9386038.1 acyltransferase [Nevskia sp.]
MDPLNPLPAIAAVLLALVSAKLLVYIDPPPKAGRYASIDGLRGFLAFFVFLHHSAYWYFFLRTGQWGGIQSYFYNHCGESAVVMFFMITAFLFISKLLDSRVRPVDWQRLYVSRVMRLVPLYLFAMAALFIYVAIASDFTLRVPAVTLLLDVGRWLGFSAFGEPDLNGVIRTSEILAGVTWSLPYEWAFYLALPLIGLMVGCRAPMRLIAFCAFSVAVITYGLKNQLAYLSFSGGLIAAFAVRSPKLCQALSGRGGSVLALVCIAATVLFLPSAYSRPALPLLAIAFVVIACGNNLFGMLVTPAARTLGKMGYSLYLLHGLLLYTVFHFVIGVDVARTLTPELHWLIALACVPILIGGCALTFRYIETPGIEASPRIEAWLKARLAGQKPKP